jgi:hypothetical protein
LLGGKEYGLQSSNFGKTQFLQISREAPISAEGYFPVGSKQQAILALRLQSLITHSDISSATRITIEQSNSRATATLPPIQRSVISTNFARSANFAEG